MGFVDLHSHVLAQLDDGAQKLADGVALGRQLSAMGFEVVHATPHQKAGFFVPSAGDIETAHGQLRDALLGENVTLELRLGAENFWDELFLQRSSKNEQPTYTGGKAFLFELDVRMAPPRLEETLFTMRLKGPLPVMAHPERYSAFWTAPDRLSTVGRTVALLVDLGALDGAHGKKECEVARRLVADGVAHAVASDVHSLADARAAGAGMSWIKKKLGAAKLDLLLDENPRRILSGELPD